MITSWTSPSRPIPRTLPTAGRGPGRREDDLDDAALLLLDDAGQDPRPEREDRDEQQDHADVREDERRVAVRSEGSSSRSSGGFDAAAMVAGSTPLGQDLAGRRGGVRSADDLGERAVVALLDDELGGAAGRVGTTSIPSSEPSLSALAGRDVRQDSTLTFIWPVSTSPSRPARSRPAASRRRPACGPGPRRR
jgi:hypothetical protein